MTDVKTIRFAIDKIITDQFAVIDSAFDNKAEIKIQSSLDFGFGDTEPKVQIRGTFSFIQNEKVMIKLTVICIFFVHPADWKTIWMKEENKFKLDRELALHLGSLTVGVARGILHAKIENEPFNNIVLPLIDLTESLHEDVLVSHNEKKRI